MQISEKLIESRKRKLREVLLLRPFAEEGWPEKHEKERMRAQMQEAGMREFPFPFDSAMAIASDVELSCRNHYAAYTDQLVKRHGLDFGDSAWLHWNRSKFPGLGFLSPEFTVGDNEPAKTYKTSLDLYEMLEEHHKGNIDHFHSFLMRGPRVVVLTQVKERDGWVTARLPKAPPNRNVVFHPFGFRVFGISVFTGKDAEVSVDQVFLMRRDGCVNVVRNLAKPDDNAFRFLRKSPVGERVYFFAIDYGVTSDFKAPKVEDINEIRIQVSGKTAKGAVKRVYLHNVHTRILLDRLAFLYDKCHFSTNLVTAHSEWHFYTDHFREVVNEKNRKRIAESPDTLESYSGSFDEGDLRFSTLADEEQSFCRVFPEITERFGIRFMTVRGLVRRPRQERFDLRNLVFPVHARADSPVYLLYRCMPAIPKHRKPVPPVVEERSRASSFPMRLEQVLSESAAQPGRVFMFYTHLGNLTPQTEPSTPFFEDAPLVLLKQRALGLSNGQPRRPRLWFTRASVLCDYALMMQTIPQAIARSGAHTVLINSWDDPILGMRLPQSARQLYGVTFYVQDSAQAEVCLDGKPITDLVRNPPDETGKESVTIATCGIPQVVFDEANPKLVRHHGQQGGEWHQEGDTWEWRIDEPEEAFSGSSYAVLRTRPMVYAVLRTLTGRLLGKPTPTVRITMSCTDVVTEGCQQLFYALKRSSEDALFGLLLETKTGGRFYFGDEELRNTLDGLTAWYVFDRRFRTVGRWWRYVVPFYDLSWRKVDPANCPLPSHPPKEITLLFRGPGRDWVALDCLEFGRPKTTTPVEGGDTVVIGGKTNTPQKGQKVFLSRLYGGDDGALMSTTTDALGGFIFEPVQPGAYVIWAAGDGPHRSRRTGLIIEARSDRFDIRL